MLTNQKSFRSHNLDPSIGEKVFSHNFSHILVVGIEIVTKAGKVVVVNYSQKEIHTIIPSPHPLDSSAKLFLMFSVFRKSVKGSLAWGCAIGVKDMCFGIEKCHSMLSWFVGRIRIGFENHRFFLLEYILGVCCWKTCL